MSGRPGAYSPEIAEQVCAMIAEGRSLREISRVDGMPTPSTIIFWSRGEYPPIADFPARYARAREIGWEVMAEEISEIVDDSRNDWMERRGADGELGDVVLNAEHVNRSRLRMEARKWLLSKRLPKTFGDKTTAEIQQLGKDGQPVDPPQFTVRFVSAEDGKPK